MKSFAICGLTCLLMLSFCSWAWPTVGMGLSVLIPLFFVTLTYFIVSDPRAQLTFRDGLFVAVLVASIGLVLEAFAVLGLLLSYVL